MKSILTFVLVLTIGTSIEAANKKRSAKKSAPRVAPGAQLKTDHSFTAATVQGRYRMPSEGMITVEDEKSVVDLLGMRLNFQDRLQAEKARD